jgi:hypothetical protein
MSLESTQNVKRFVYENIEVYIFKDKPPFGNEVTFYFVHIDPDTKNSFFWNARKCWDGSLAKEKTFEKMPSRLRREYLFNEVFAHEIYGELVGSLKVL